MLCIINHITINNQKSLFGCEDRIYMKYCASRTRYSLRESILALLILIYLVKCALGNLSHS